MFNILFNRLSAFVDAFCSSFRTRTELALENLALRQQLAVLKKKRLRPRIYTFDRVFWVWIRKLWSGWINSLIIVQPDTVIQWHRRGFRLYWRFISSRGKPNGRPDTVKEIRDLIRRMHMENHTWGAPRIHGELLKLGYSVSERTVSRLLPKRTSSPDRVQKWKAFLRNHKEAIAAMDFFTVPTVAFKILYVFFVIDHGRRKIIHHAVTFNPTAEWVLQQLREAFPFDQVPRYLIFDRDSIFCERVKQAIKSFGIKPVQTMYRSPWQNGTAERWVGSSKRELLDHVVVFGPDHLRRLLREYVEYYNNDRTHYNLEKDSPNTRPIEPRPDGKCRVTARPRLGGIHHLYTWKQAS